jgi:cytochrome c-type biogenesis protein CcmE
MKIGITVLVLVLAFTGLLLATLKDGVEAYKEVDEVLASPTDWSGKKFQVHGFVVADSIMVKPDTLEYRFKVQNNGKIIDATYKGLVPDTFQDKKGEEAEVVLKGQLNDGSFHVQKDGITAKCPSKYEALKRAS